MGTIRVHPDFERKIKRMQEKMREQYPRRRITIVNITANCDINEQEVEQDLIKRKRRRNRYFY